MINSQRTFVETVKKYCLHHDIALDIKSQGWLLIMRKGTKCHLALGYDLGLNSSVTHRVANDKAATADVMESCGIPCIPHTLFLNPNLSNYIPTDGSWEEMLRILDDNPAGIVVKPNEGTGGNFVFKVSTRSKLELAVNKIFSSNRSLSISPYFEIQEEVRVILVDYAAVVVYRKRRPSVVGDGTRSLLELILVTISPDRLSTILPDVIEDLDQSDLDIVPPPGQRHTLNWRHNLGRGAEPVLLESGEAREACVNLALSAAKAISLRFGSIDVVRHDETWRILEINSGVMMESLSKQYPDIVDSAYGAALDQVFNAISQQ